MVQKTDLNVAPYYDDYDSSSNYVRTLFRPGFAIQARELTQLQTSLQQQIDVHGKHIFKEGAMVIPGQVSLISNYFSLKLASTFAGETVDPSQYYSATTPVTITGASSGVTATVIGYDAATTDDQPTLYLNYKNTGTDNYEKAFRDGENISANAGVTHTTAYSSDAASATTYTSAFSAAIGSTEANLRSSTGPAAATGAAVNVQSGIYFVRGFFVECLEETLVLDKYDPSGSWRVGFEITETLVKPEDVSSLLDNATGSSNYTAKGAHRLKISLALKKLDIDSISDGSFIELLTSNAGAIQSKVRNTEYNILEETIARRTFDESGDYTVRPFSIVMRECVNLNERVGTYTAGEFTDGGKIADNTYLTAQISTGKAYVRGYEVEKVGPTFKDLKKARDFETVNAGITTFDLGNYTLINNVYGTPDISAISGETTAYKTISLYDHFISTDGSVPASSGVSLQPIGQARARAMEWDTGTIGTDEAKYKLYLFDVKMFTFLTLDGTPSPTLIANWATGGTKITGVTSGATAWVVNNIATTTGTRLICIKQSGKFSSGEKIKASDSSESDQIVENSSNTDLTLTSDGGTPADDTRTFEQCRSMVMVDATAAQSFTADLVLEVPQRRKGVINNLTLDGTDADSANANNSFTQDDGDDDPSGGIIMETNLIPKLVSPEKNSALEKLSKQTIKTLLTDSNSGASDTQYTVRRQFIGTTTASGVVTFTTGTNETFASHAEKDYVMSILTPGGGSGTAGQLVSISDTIGGTGTGSITITDTTILGSAAKVKLIATILRTSVKQKTKTTRLMKQVKVATGTTDAYGTRPGDRDISLGRVDAFKLAAVFDSQDTSTDAVAPTITTGSITGTFTRGEKITGATSGATGRIISTSSPFSYVSTNASTFDIGDVITGESSTATATITATTVGDIVITGKYLLDTGQRDNFYDIARIIRKRNRAAPIGKLLVVYDYLEHGAGDMFTVDSYTDIAKQMEYDDIPVYSASKIDVDEPEPSGKFPLYDTYDFRPAVDDITGTSTTLTTVDEITAHSFNFYSRSFGGTGGTTVDTPKPGSFVQSDFEYYLPKFAAIILNPKGTFLLIEGESAENPLLPKTPDDCMLVATLFVPAYTFDPKNVTIRKQKHQRYTMKDIGKIAKRLDHVEYYTALSLLEREAESFEVTDANGLNRFKSGFVVDNFKGHRIGDVAHRDYNNSMDFGLGQLRPKHKSRAIDLIESVANNTDTARAGAGYQKTGDLITLPYDEAVMTTQPYATRTERISSRLVSSWRGDIELSPSSDTWFETEVLPDLIVNEEGDYDAVMAQEANNLGTVWNSWQTQWSGVVETKVDNWTEGGTQFRPNRFDVTRTTETVRTDQTRTGVDTQVDLRIDRVSQGLRVVSQNVVPVMRSKTITFTGVQFKPVTRLWAYFNKQDVSNYCTPASASYTTSDANLVAGDPLVTNAVGKIEGTFVIPDPKVAGNPTFACGDVVFKLTSSEHDGIVSTEQRPGTLGEALYSASGMLETQQETIIATRNATITRSGVSGNTSFNTVTSNDVRKAAGNFNDEQAMLAAMNAEIAAAKAEARAADGRAKEARRIADQAAQDAAVVKNKPTTTKNIDESGNITQGWDYELIGQKNYFDWGVTSWIPDFTVYQTFKAHGDPAATTNGVFITSVETYHQAKDETLPVILELRNVVNGYPGPKVLPFGKVTKETGDINISDTAATATKWTFPSPIYLETETEYCIVLHTVSPEHKVWIARMGETDTGGTRTISEQPHIGVLFKGHGNTGWAAAGMEDLKFTVNYANFTSSGGTFTLTNDDVPLASLQEDPFIITDASTVLQVNHADHGMYATSNNVTIAGAQSPATTTLNGAISATATTLTLSDGGNFDDVSGIYAALSGTWYIKIDDEIMTYTAISTNSVSSITREVDSTTAAAHADGATVELYMAHQVPFTEINKTHTAVANTEIDSYTVTLTSTPVVDGSGSQSSIGGSSATATENAMMDTLSTILGILELPNTSLSAKALVVRGTSPSGAQTSFENTRDDELVPEISFPLNDNYKFDVPYMICSSINETNELSSQRSLEIQITMETSTPWISPVIDLSRSSMIAVSNRLNEITSSADVYPTAGYVGSKKPEGDENAAIYLTKQINLDTLATGLRVIFAAHRPATSDIKLMYRLLPIDESEDFDNLGYTYFNTDGSPDTAVASSSTINDFQEYQYTAGVSDEGVGTPLPEFIAFQIKIVMTGTSTSEPPRLKALRVIALGT
ncbi:hypothetical protein CMI47_08240 [Candidatus Pacearchaeota archaeon]|nr:hypothetical protein [Candidatus Pacearchaeota archaeon]